MKQFLILAVVVVVAAARRHNSLLDNEWELFKGKFGKAYTSTVEESRRRGVWESNVALIAKHNREYDLGKHTFTLGLNQYADLSNQEFRQIMNGYRGSVQHRSNVVFQSQNKALPDTVDWRTKNVVTPIKDQGQCGSCWAFSTTGSVEGQHALKTGVLVSLSEQELVDCSQKEGNQGCNGGLMDQGFQYIIDNKGIDTEDSYPYTAEDDNCKADPKKDGATVKGFVDVKSGSEDDLKEAVATVGPVSVAIDASTIFFQLYSSGVYTDPFCSTTALDHGVLAIGYGTDNGKDYWLVKNSWGESWGMKGFIKMARNHSNMCGIATQASYPQV